MLGFWLCSGPASAYSLDPQAIPFGDSSFTQLTHQTSALVPPANAERVAAMAVRCYAAAVVLLLIAAPFRCIAQSNSLVVSAEVFGKLKALFMTKEENYISRQGELLHTRPTCAATSHQAQSNNTRRVF